MLIVADTSPLNYLILIDAVEILPQLYGRIVVPPQVCQELRHPDAPPGVQAWIIRPPGWLEIKAPSFLDPTLLLDAGEVAAIALAQELHADRLLIDERDGRDAAQRLGIPVAGTLAVLKDAALAGLVDLRSTLQRVTSTPFRASPRLLEQILDDFEKDRRKPPRDQP